MESDIFVDLALSKWSCFTCNRIQFSTNTRVEQDLTRDIIVGRLKPIKNIDRALANDQVFYWSFINSTSILQQCENILKTQKSPIEIDGYDDILHRILVL